MQTIVINGWTITNNDISLFQLEKQNKFHLDYIHFLRWRQWCDRKDCNIGFWKGISNTSEAWSLLVTETRPYEQYLNGYSQSSLSFAAWWTRAIKAESTSFGFSKGAGTSMDWIRGSFVKAERNGWGVTMIACKIQKDNEIKLNNYLCTSLPSPILIQTPFPLCLRPPI